MAQPAIPIEGVHFINVDEDAIYVAFEEFTGEAAADLTVYAKLTTMPNDADEDGDTVIEQVTCEYLGAGVYKGVWAATKLDHGAEYVRQFDVYQSGELVDQRKIGVRAAYRGAK